MASWSLGWAGCQWWCPEKAAADTRGPRLALPQHREAGISSEQMEKRGGAEVPGKPGCGEELLRAPTCRGGDRNSQQIPSQGRTTHEKAQQTSDRSRQDADLGSQAGQVEAPDGRERREGTVNDDSFIQPERFQSLPEGWSPAGAPAAGTRGADSGGWASGWPWAWLARAPGGKGGPSCVFWGAQGTGPEACGLGLSLQVRATRPLGWEMVSGASARSNPGSSWGHSLAGRSMAVATSQSPSLLGRSVDRTRVRVFKMSFCRDRVARGSVNPSPGAVCDDMWEAPLEGNSPGKPATARPVPVVDPGRCWATPSLGFPRIWRVPSPLEGEARGTHTHTHTHTRKGHGCDRHTQTADALPARGGSPDGPGPFLQGENCKSHSQGWMSAHCKPTRQPSLPCQRYKETCPPVLPLGYLWGGRQTITWILHHAVLEKDVADTLPSCVFFLLQLYIISLSNPVNMTTNFLNPLCFK